MARTVFEVKLFIDPYPRVRSQQGSYYRNQEAESNQAIPQGVVGWARVEVVNSVW